MDLSLKLLSIFALIVAAAYFAISEISLAGSRRVRLTQMVENGDKRAQEVINLQEKPGPFFSVIHGCVCRFVQVVCSCSILRDNVVFVFIPSDHDVVHYLC